MGQNSGISRRRVVQGAAWAAPAVVIATAAPAIASSHDNPLTGTTVSPPVSQGNNDRFQVTVALPPGVILTGATFTLSWNPTGSVNASASVRSGAPWSPVSSSAPSVVFTAPGTLTNGSTFDLIFSNGKTGTTWSGVLAGAVNGVQASVTLSGVL